ncbi:hypothetical protein [uncultured Cocleimonas sp.]|uniref:hypothetical protein n=1 Tax=uncultured Cocleimonas sp. TaxID=1051587 RepID=UPI0026040D88|nr:hypothetical protein [uncultured Cocleimonas sp.]
MSETLNFFNRIKLNMKIKLIFKLFLLLTVFNAVNAEVAQKEITILGCPWIIPNTMTITKHEKSKSISIVSKFTKDPNYRLKVIKVIKVQYSKEDLKEFIDSMDIKKTVIGQYNNFNIFSLTSNSNTAVNAVNHVLYESTKGFALVSNFTERERLLITEKCF